MKNQGMYVNGPMVGRIIDLPDPVPASLVVAVNLNPCEHSSNTITDRHMLHYKINKPANSMLPYVIALDSPFDDTGWYCPTCKAEAEVKYKLNQIKDLLGLNDEDEDE